MAGPFFRGMDLMDWTFLVVLQAAVDAQAPDLGDQLADIFGLESRYSYNPPLIVAPPVYVWVTGPYVFIVSGSTTEPALQMVGNVLGSPAAPLLLAPGSCPVYFSSIAIAAWGQLGARIKEDAVGRQIVLVGFSLGGAVVTILKAILAANGLASSCVTTGSPRSGDTDFVSAYDNSNFNRLLMVNDPVASFPPPVWTATGYHNVWTPFPPLIVYSHVDPGWTLSLPANVVPGGEPMTTADAILSVDIGIWVQWHNALLYARTLRTGLPDVIPDGFDGFPGAGSFDAVAAQVFSYDPTGWPWGYPKVHNTTEVSGMLSQIAIYIRDTAGTLGFKEIFYVNADPDNTFTQNLVNSRTAPIITARSLFLSKSCEIYAARVSAVRTGLVPLVRKSALFKFTDNPVPGVLGVTEDIQACLVFDGWTLDRSVKRQFHFRGIDFTWITADKLAGGGITAVAPGGIVDSYFKALNNAGMVALTATSSSQHAFTQVAKTTQDSPVILTVPTGSTLTLGEPPLCEVRGCRQAPLLNGRWLVSVNPTDNTLITLVGSQKFSAPASATGTIRTVDQEPSAQNISIISFSDVSSKKTGRPDFLPRGRRSAQLRHR